MLKPLGNRILVQPDAPAESTDSGLVLPQDRDHIPMSGTVVAVGNGPARDAKIRAAAIKRCMAVAEKVTADYSHFHAVALLEALRAYLAQAETFEHVINVGDRVAYPIECGSVLTEDGISYIVLNEDDVVVLVTEQEAAA
jgi:co-chaperonin GroES (HSP10)